MTTLMCVLSVDTPLHRPSRCPAGVPLHTWTQWPQGCHQPDASTFFFQFTVVRESITLHGTSFTDQVDCNAQTSELGRLSIGRGGLPLFACKAAVTKQQQEPAQPLRTVVVHHFRVSQSPRCGRFSHDLHLREINPAFCQPPDRCHQLFY